MDGEETGCVRCCAIGLKDGESRNDSFARAGGKEPDLTYLESSSTQTDSRKCVIPENEESYVSQCVDGVFSLGVS